MREVQQSTSPRSVCDGVISMNKQINWVVLALAASVAPGMVSCELGAISDRVAEAADDRLGETKDSVDSAEEPEAAPASASAIQLAEPSPIASASSSGNTLVFPEKEVITSAHVPQGFVAWVWASGLSEPSGIAVDEIGNTLVVERDLGRILALWDADNDGASGPSERAVIAEAPGIDGLVLHDGYLFASSATTVFRWRYSPTHALLGEASVVVTGLESAGKTALFVNDQGLYLATSEAAESSVAVASIVRKYANPLSEVSVAYDSGEVLARRADSVSGFGIDATGKLWEIGAGIEADPGAEVQAPAPGGMRMVADGAQGDSAPSELLGNPVLAFPAEAEAAGILFPGGPHFPEAFRGDALVTFHGAWNGDRPIGHKVVRVVFGDDGMPTGASESMFKNSCEGDGASSWEDRPVGLAQRKDGTLLISSDGDADRIVALGYRGQ
jgi:glucose/arabinose dehydrogenase